VIATTPVVAAAPEEKNRKSVRKTPEKLELAENVQVAENKNTLTPKNKKSLSPKKVSWLFKWTVMVIHFTVVV
jgi:hypothetical protein